MYDIIIIGAGPAGLTAAIYAARAGKKVLVLEEVTYGGQIVKTNNLENYPGVSEISGVEFAKTLYEQAKEFGVDFKFEKAIRIDNMVMIPPDGSFYMPLLEVDTEEDSYDAPALIIATGTRYKTLGLEYEKELEGRGVSYCATCDGAFYKGKTVIVEGGGNTALYDAEYLAGICKKVFLVHRRSEFRGDKALFERVSKLPNVEIITPAAIGGLLVFAEKMRFLGVWLKKTDGETGEVISDENIREIGADGLFIAIGSEPNSGFEGLCLFEEGMLKRDEQGYIVAGEDCKTTFPGVFVAGDVRTSGLKQVVTATADGARAASSAIDFLNNL